jgi:hypothetical protein
MQRPSFYQEEANQMNAMGSDDPKFLTSPPLQVSLDDAAFVFQGSPHLPCSNKEDIKIIYSQPNDSQQIASLSTNVSTNTNGSLIPNLKFGGNSFSSCDIGYEFQQPMEEEFGGHPNIQVEGDLDIFDMEQGPQTGVSLGSFMQIEESYLKDNSKLYDSIQFDLVSSQTSLVNLTSNTITTLDNPSSSPMLEPNITTMVCKGPFNINHPKPADRCLGLSPMNQFFKSNNLKKSHSEFLNVNRPTIAAREDLRKKGLIYCLGLTSKSTQSKGVQAKNVVKEFGKKSLTYIRDQCDMDVDQSMLKTFIRSVLKTHRKRNFGVELDDVPDIQKFLKRFLKWLNDRKKDFETKATIRDMLSLTSESEKDFVFRNLLQVVMFHFVKFEYEIWIHTSPQMKNQYIYYDYKEKVKQLVTDPVNCK